MSTLLVTWPEVPILCISRFDKIWKENSWLYLCLFCPSFPFVFLTPRFYDTAQTSYHPACSVSSSAHFIKVKEKHWHRTKIWRRNLSGQNWVQLFYFHFVACGETKQAKWCSNERDKQKSSVLTKKMNSICHFWEILCQTWLRMSLVWRLFDNVNEHASQ